MWHSVRACCRVLYKPRKLKTSGAHLHVTVVLRTTAPLRLEMQASVMTTLSLRPEGQCNGSFLLASSTSRRPCISWSRRQQRPTKLHRQQMQQRSVATVHHDNLEEVDDPLGKNPCNFHPSIWGDFFLHYYDAAASSKQQVHRLSYLLYWGCQDPFFF